MALETFTVKQALKIQREQIRWYSGLIKDKKKKREFLRAVRKLTRKRKYSSPYDVPRGVEIESLYYTISKGYSDSQYSDYLRSLD